MLLKRLMIDNNNNEYKDGQAIDKIRKLKLFIIAS
jgi:hypothetical protein